MALTILVYPEWRKSQNLQDKKSVLRDTVDAALRLQYNQID
jgi:hypothetical protein